MSQETGRLGVSVVVSGTQDTVGLGLALPAWGKALLVSYSG